MALPEFDGMLIARKGKGWMEEFERFVRYAFASHEEGCTNGIASFVAAQIWSLRSAPPKDFRSLTDLAEFEDFAAFLAEKVVEKWGKDPVVNYEPHPGVSFVCFVFGRQNIQTYWKNFLSEKRFEKRHKVREEIYDENTVEKEDAWFEMFEKTSFLLGEFIQTRYTKTEFPNDNESMAGIQLYPVYSEFMLGGRGGLTALKDSVLQIIQKNHDESENRQESPENRLLRHHQEAATFSKENTSQEPLHHRKAGSVRFWVEEEKQTKVWAWGFLLPIRSPEALNDLLAIPYNKCDKICNLYLNFIAKIIFPNYEFEGRNEKRKIPTNF